MGDIFNILLGKMFIRDDEKELKMTLELAKNNHWSRCPGCLYIVEMKVRFYTKEIYIF